MVGCRAIEPETAAQRLPPLAAFPLSYALHVSEEAWCGETFPVWASRLSGALFTREEFIVLNGVAFAMMCIAAAGASRWPLARQIVVPALGTIVAGNGALHVIASLLPGTYSPALFPAHCCGSRWVCSRCDGPPERCLAGNCGWGAQPEWWHTQLSAPSPSFDKPVIDQSKVGRISATFLRVPDRASGSSIEPVKPQCRYLAGTAPGSTECPNYQDPESGLTFGAASGASLSCQGQS